MHSIHISDVRSFRTCRRKWNWSSPLGRNLEPVIPYAPFFTGRAIHACLEYYYRDGIPFDNSLEIYLKSEEANMEQVGEMWPHEKITFEKELELIQGLLHHYGLWVAQDESKYNDKNLKFISLETPFEVPMPMKNGRPSKQMTLGGRFDGVVQHLETGQYWIWETKTTRSIAELTGSLVNDEQSGAYMYAASKFLGVPIVGVLYNMMRKKVPTLPKILQDGSFSKSKSTDTTSFFYREEIKATYPDWSDETIDQMYGSILATLKETDNEFFMRFPVYHSPYEIKMLMQGVHETGKEMINKKIPLYPAPGVWTCKFCAFKSPCLAMNVGSDYEVLLNAEYQQRQSQTSVREAPESE